MALEPLEMEQLHPRPSSSTTRPAAMSAERHNNILDRVGALVRLYMELHPVIASIAVFVLLTMAVSLAVTVLFPRHGPRRNRMHHDYSQIEYNYNFRASQLDHWCLFVSFHRMVSIFLGHVVAPFHSWWLSSCWTCLLRDAHTGG